MDYNHISGFLNKFKQILFKNEEYYTVISLAIQNHTSFLVDSKQIKLKGTIIYIQSSPIQRSEILLHKVGILSDIKLVLPERTFTDIR